MRWTVLFLLFFSFTQQVLAETNPFAKKASLNIGDESAWRIAGGAATKTANDDKGLFYHLLYDAKQLRLSISTDESGNQPKTFKHLEVIDVLVDKQRLPLFSWCLNNQTEHSRYLQQGLSVKKDVCVVDGNTGQVTLWLDDATAASLKQGEELTVVIKPYRSSLSLQYALSDFSAMQSALAEKAAKLVAAKNCWVKPPQKNQTIKAIQYTCGDVAAEKNAKAAMTKQLADARAVAAKQKQQREQAQAIAKAEALKKKQAAEKIARQKQLDKERRAKKMEAAHITQIEQQAEQGERLLEEQTVAENAVKHSELGVEITGKMVAMCQKYWNKGEHRCYCEKFIEYAPQAIQANSSCP